MTVSKARHRHQPKTSHHPHENSQARFLQLDKIKNEENHPVQSQSVLRSAPRGLGKRKPAQALWKLTQSQV